QRANCRRRMGKGQRSARHHRPPDGAQGRDRFPFERSSPTDCRSPHHFDCGLAEEEAREQLGAQEGVRGSAGMSLYAETNGFAEYHDIAHKLLSDNRDLYLEMSRMTVNGRVPTPEEVREAMRQGRDD